MKNYELKILYFLKFIVAFCSIVYELALAQALSAFLSNTILRYSMTIGLYMCSMGFGALAAEGRMIRKPALTLLWIEVLLTVVGGFSLLFLFGLDQLFSSGWGFILFSHVLIVAIGLLTGFEIPLVIKLLDEFRPGRENIILAIDYAGALLGTVIFAFIFYPRWGLMPTIFCVALLNAGAGLLLAAFVFFVSKEMSKEHELVFYLQIAVAAVLFGCFLSSVRLNDYFLNLYLG